jgi:hypothetical protein
VKALDAGAWKDANVKGVLDAGTWKTPAKVSVLDGGAWKQVWPTGGGSPIPEVKGTPTAAAGTTVALPAHAVGDLIVVFAQNHNTLSAAAPTMPATAGTVPAWNTLYKNASNEGVPIHVGWFLATATDHTCGAWTGANGVSAVVFTNVNQTQPIGSSGGVKTISTAGSSPVIPALEDPGPSALMTYYAVAYSTGGFGDPPAGYTKHFSDARLCINSKSDTNSYAPVPMPHSSGASLTWRDVAFEVLPEAAAPPVEEQPYLYGVDQVNKPGRVVDFTALKGFVPEGEAALDEGFMFRCSTISGLDGLVRRTFTKTFPSGTAYTKFECTLADQYGDGIPANNAEMMKTISFTVYPTA